MKNDHKRLKILTNNPSVVYVDDVTDTEGVGSVLIGAFNRLRLAVLFRIHFFINGHFLWLLLANIHLLLLDDKAVRTAHDERVGIHENGITRSQFHSVPFDTLISAVRSINCVSHLRVFAPLDNSQTVATRAILHIVYHFRSNWRIFKATETVVVNETIPERSTIVVFLDVEQRWFVYASFSLPFDRIRNKLFDCDDLNDTRQK